MLTLSNLISLPSNTSINLPLCPHQQVASDVGSASRRPALTPCQAVAPLPGCGVCDGICKFLVAVA